MFAYLRNIVVSLFVLLLVSQACEAQQGNYYLTWRNFLNSAAFLTYKTNQNSEMVATNDYYWSGEIEREFKPGLRIGLALATAKRSHRFPNRYTVDIDKYFQKSFSIGIGGKLYNVYSENDIKLQGGLYAYLNWLDYRDVFQINHFYGVYEEEMNFEKKAISSFLAHFAFLHQATKHFEVEYAFQISLNQQLENLRGSFYYLASTGRVRETGVAIQFHMNLKYAIFEKK